MPTREPHTWLMNPQVLFDVAVVIGVTWFWIRRARPALLALAVEPLAIRLGVIATVIAVVAASLHGAATAANAGTGAAGVVLLAGGFVWIVVVGLGYPEYRFLRHATGSARR